MDQLKKIKLQKQNTKTKKLIKNKTRIKSGDCRITQSFCFYKKFRCFMDVCAKGNKEQKEQKINEQQITIWLKLGQWIPSSVLTRKSLLSLPGPAAAVIDHRASDVFIVLNHATELFFDFTTNITHLTAFLYCRICRLKKYFAVIR